MKIYHSLSTDHPRPKVSFEGEVSLTKQAMKEECDVNVIVKKAQKAGFMPPATRQARYGDFSDVPSYHEALERVTQAQEMFMTIPAEVRKRFNNDPGQFLAFASDHRNAEELVKLGLAKARPTPNQPDDQPSKGDSTRFNANAGKGASKTGASPSSSGGKGDDA